MKRTLGNITEETHKEIVIIKATKGFKSIEQTINYLLDIHKKYFIKLELEKEENINNSNIQEIKASEESEV